VWSGSYENISEIILELQLVSRLKLLCFNCATTECSKGLLRISMCSQGGHCYGQGGKLKVGKRKIGQTGGEGGRIVEKSD